MTATHGEVASSFSNLRLDFTAPVADGGEPGLTSAEEFLLSAAATAWCTAFLDIAGQMVLDLADIAIEGELTREYDEIDGQRITAILLKPTVTLRTGFGFEKVHDMFRRATSLAKQRSPVLRVLEQGTRITVEPSYR